MPRIQDKVKKALKKDAASQLSSEDLLKIRGIYISDIDANAISVPWVGTVSAHQMVFPEVMFNINHSENGQWVSDLQLFPHLQSLRISVPLMTETPLFFKELTNLRELYIIGPNQLNWAFIENLTNLEFFLISHCNFSDLTPLANLSKKQVAAHEKAKEKSSQTGELILFRGLRNLCLNDCEIEDISPLAECPYISDLNLSHNKISDLSPLSKISSLYYLTLRYNRISDITPLQNLRRLYYLNLRHNNISDISIFKKFDESYNLGRLFLGHNNITDFSPLYRLFLVASDVWEHTNEGRFHEFIMRRGKMEFKFIEETLETKYPHININDHIWHELVTTANEYGPGWHDLIIELLQKIEAIYRENNMDISDFKIHRIREKYGQLCIDASSSIKKVHEIISEYEDKANTICEECGEPGSLCENKGGWLSTLCKKCASEQSYEKIENN